MMSIPGETTEDNKSNNQRPERRQRLRIDMSGQLEGCLLPELTPIAVLEVGRGGFSMRLSRACAVGDVYDVQLWSAVCLPVVLSARVVHTVRANVPDRPAEYFVGLEFVDNGASYVEQAIDRLIHSIQETPAV